MSLHISVISICGDRRSEVADLFHQCGYAVEKSFLVHNSNDVLRELDWRAHGGRVAKAVYLSGEWTSIVDPELVLVSEDVWLEFSRRWSTRVFGWICEGASGSYGIAMFDSGVKTREVVSMDGNVVIDEGTPLAEESSIDWTKAWDDDVLEIAKKLGAVYDYLADREYLILRLNSSHAALPTSAI